MRTRRPCFKETIAKYLDFDFGRLVLGLAAASGRLNGKLHVILVRYKREIAVGRQKVWCQNTVYFVYGELVILPFSTRLFVSYGNCFLFPKSQIPTKPPHFMKHITYCPPKSEPFFFINTCKSLRSKITLLYRFKIFRAILHTVTNSHKNFLIALSLRFIKQLHRSEF